MKANNYDFDTLTIYVKKTKASEIVENYKSFGWQLTSKEENSRYEDIIDLTFERKHKIKNKDELQLLQIYMEDKLNSLGKLEHNKNPKTTTFGLSFGIIGLLFVFFGTLFASKLLVGLTLFGSISLMIIGIVFLVITVIGLPKLNKSEMTNFEKTSKLLKAEIEEICNQASRLFGGDEDGN